MASEDNGTLSGMDPVATILQCEKPKIRDVEDLGYIAAGTDMLVVLDMAICAWISRRRTPGFVLSCRVVKVPRLIFAFYVYPTLGLGSGRSAASRSALYAVFSAYELLRI